MSNEESKNDAAQEARAFISIVGNCGLYPDKAQRWISALCDEVEQLRSLNQTQAESIETFQSQFRVMKEAIEAVIVHFQMRRDVTNAAFAKGLPVVPMPAKELQLTQQLESAITPKGSQK